MSWRRLSVPPVRVVLLAPLLLAGLFMRWPFIHGRISPQLGTDTIAYFAITDGMKDGHFFAASGTDRGAPGYSMFIWLTDQLGGAREVNLALAQHVIGLAVAVAVFLWAWRRIDPPTAILSGALLAIAPVMFVSEDEALPDFLLGALLIAFVIVLASGALRPPAERRWWWMAAAGVVLGAATLTKPIAEVAILAVPITLAFAGGPRGAVVRGTLLALGGFFVVVGPFLVQAAVRYGEPTLTAQSGATLFVREFEIGGRPIPTDTRDGRIISDAVQGLAEGGVTQRTYITGLQALERVRGINSRQALQRERGLALHSVAKHPFGYAWKTLQLSDRFFPEALGNETLAAPNLPRAGTNATGFTHAVWRVGGWLANRWWAFSIHGLAVLFALLLGTQQRRVACMALVSTGVCVAIGTAALHGGLPRYSWGMAPLTYTAGFAGIVVGIAAFWRGARGIPPRRLTFT
jgi:hypothetical protein